MGSMPAMAGLVATVLMGFAAAAQANGEDLLPVDRQERNRELLRLATRSELTLEQPLVLPRTAFELDRKGIRYRSDFSLAGREMEMRIGGPIYKAIRQKRFGLTVEIRF
jgi:hypothetical protein